MKLTTILIVLLFSCLQYSIAQVETGSSVSAIPLGKIKPKPEGFDLKKSKVILSSEHFRAYNQLQKSRIIQTIFGSIWNGKLTAYKSALLNEKLTRQEFQNLSAKKRKIQVPNPNNPNDIYDVIDTIITGLSTPWQALGFEIDYNNNAFTELFSDTQSAYFKIDDIKTVLNKEQLAFLKIIKESSIKTITDSSLVVISDSLFNHTSVLLYNIGISGKEKAYSSLFFDQTISPERISDIGTYKFSLSIPNPDNPEDIYDLIDTVVLVSFTDNKPTKIKVYHTWEKTENHQVKITPYAFAPMYKQIIGNAELKPANLFLLIAKDVKRNCSDEFYTYLNNLAVAVLRNNGSDEVYKGALFQDLE